MDHVIPIFKALGLRDVRNARSRATTERRVLTVCARDNWTSVEGTRSRWCLAHGIARSTAATGGGRYFWRNPAATATSTIPSTNCWAIRRRNATNHPIRLSARFRCCVGICGRDGRGVHFGATDKRGEGFFAAVRVTPQTAPSTPAGALALPSVSCRSDRRRQGLRAVPRRGRERARAVCRYGSSSW